MPPAEARFSLRPVLPADLRSVMALERSGFDSGIREPEDVFARRVYAMEGFRETAELPEFFASGADGSGVVMEKKRYTAPS
jgi:hypothetical protein